MPGEALIHHRLDSGVTVHMHACGEGGIFANAYLIESRAGVVAVDATLSETESRKLRKELEAIEKGTAKPEKIGK